MNRELCHRGRRGAGCGQLPRVCESRPSRSDAFLLVSFCASLWPNSRMPRSSDTITALATPVGTSAIAVVRVSGSGTAKLTAKIFGETPPPRVARRGDYRGENGVLLDDVIFTFFPENNSYTGEDALEVSCHGNPFIAQSILEDLLARGCRAAGPGEFTQRAFLNGRMDLSQAEAVMDLIHARSERALAAANQQLRGGLGRRLNDLTERLLGALARVEAYIDFPDEDLPPEDRAIVQRTLAALLHDTDRMLATSHYGELLRDGIKTVIIGAPNAGKSSLLNQLVGQERAIVSPEPGTTRDFIEARIIVGPHSLRLIDTAGLNPNPGGIEKLGIKKSLERAAAADLILVVVDASSTVPAIPEILTELMVPTKTLVVANKIDLLSGRPLTLAILGGLPLVEVSALTGAGIESLVTAIIRLADSLQPPSDEDFVAINARHADALGRARSDLQAALSNLTSNGPVELLASDLRGTLSAFGDILGKVDNERMLDQLFATFCIGK
ncbi:MAG: tRNA uridine-5-carboxymethylaminomethyl(34) synthesis GTPase MnmE [Opitutaceae bacterium]